MSKCLLHAGLWFALFANTSPTCFGDGAIESAAAVSASPSKNRISPFVQQLQQICPSTVNIHTEKRQKLDVMLNLSPSKGSRVNGMGTGIILDERGYIVTNHHVVQDVESLRVTLWNKESYDAQVVRTDKQNDLAIIKITPRSPLPVAPFGTSSDLILGEDVYAIGNAYGWEHSVTRGIVSALKRDVEVNEEQAYKNLIQTDAAINPGNSGGPLLNADGEIVGINVAIRAGAQRIGFAIPIDDARVIVARLMSVETLESHFHGLVTTDDKRGTERKLVVKSVSPNSPAAEAGLQAGDVITKAGIVKVTDGVDLERALLGKSIGEKIELMVRRDSETSSKQISVAALSPERANAVRAQLNSGSTLASGEVRVAEKPVVGSAAKDRSWEILGVTLEKLPTGDSSLTGQQYRGGMRVADVRPQSPASLNGIRRGDILVGLHVWETIDRDNIDFVLNHPDFRTINPLKFYIVRGGETLFGHFNLTAAR
ncbi:trypsin-like peptidase domain-containing protein [Planctomyces sp. SH-PL14]|uniref:trypsin-like peptidase domain-containing protein n=1 Tax=Planctomyces sp. SH-PL14 TaxID=1632864 RepID=UPI00078B1728|nr:trypsin-like peptidase domain-containing protein [Planctomyces sp. SH-PL14]AMV20051.1 Putative serine protease HhoA precursor [Planctomyces sp. SH-PL14]